MTIAITGASGLLSTALIAELVGNTDKPIVAFTQSSKSDVRKRWADADPSVNWDVVEVRETKPTYRDDNFRLPEGIDWLVNCAFPRNRGGTELAKGMDYQRRLFESAAQAEVGAVVNVSSQSVYRTDRVQPAGEDAEIDLDTPYAAAKFATELLAESALGRIPLIQGRLASLIAPNFEQRVVNKLVHRAMAGHDLSITTPHVSFDYMDVRDAARAIVSIIAISPASGAHPLNVGSGVSHSLAQIAKAVASHMRTEFGLTTNVNLGISDDRRSSALDCDKLKTKYGFSPLFPLERTIRDIARASQSR